MYKKFSLIVILVLFSLLMSGQDGYKALLKTLYQGTVPLIYPKDLAGTRQAIILDARSRKEYAVSHLTNARFVDYDTFDPAMVANVPKSETIVVYCSVGYRSEKIGERLMKEGYKNVYNLYGGLFQWVNEGRPVVNMEGVQTDSVHTYNKEWSVWLHKGIKVYE